MGVRISEIQEYRDETDYTIILTGNNNETHEIATTVTSHPGIARQWIYDIFLTHSSHRHRLVVGLGLQWTPSTYYCTNDPAATLQLCVGRRCLIFQLYRAQSSPLILRRFLSDPQITFVGIWNPLDASKLMESEHELEMKQGMPIDLRHHVEDSYGRDLYQSSIAEIAEEMLGVDIEWSQEVSRSDWEDEELSQDQVQQAAVKAFVAYAVGMTIGAWKLNPN